MSREQDESKEDQQEGLTAKGSKTADSDIFATPEINDPLFDFNVNETLEIGSVFGGKYEILSQLGHGGMEASYRAEGTDL